MNKVRFKIGDSGLLNLANLSIQYGDASAVTLIDVVVFSDQQTARNPAIWAHELRHVEQFSEWGTRNFAIRYLRDHHAVEEEAYGVEFAFPQWQASQKQIEESVVDAAGNPISQKYSVFVCSGTACVAGDIPLGHGHPTQYGDCDVNHVNGSLSMTRPVKRMLFWGLDQIRGDKSQLTVSHFEMSTGAYTAGPAAKHFTVCGWSPDDQPRRARLTIMFEY